MQKFVVTTLLAGEYEHAYYEANTIDAVYEYLFKSEYILTNHEDILFRFRNIDDNSDNDDIGIEIDNLLNSITIDEIKEYHQYYHTGGYGYQEGIPAKKWKTITIEEFAEPLFINIYDIMKTMEEINLQLDSVKKSKEKSKESKEVKKVNEVSFNLKDVKEGNIKKLRKMIFRNEVDNESDNESDNEDISQRS